MVRNTSRIVLGACFGVILSGPSLFAATVDRTVNISSGSFISSLSLGGSLTVSSQNAKVTLTAGSVLGTPFSVTADVVLPTQTVGLSLIPNPTPVNSPVTGNFVLRGEDNYDAVGPDPNDGGDYQLVPGMDGLFDDGNSANSAMDLIVASTNVNLLNQNFQTNNVQLNGSVGIDILGLTTISFGAQINGNVAGNMTASFDSTGPSNEIVGAQDNSTFPDGSHPYINPGNPNVNAAPDGVDNLGVAGTFLLPGDFNAAINAALNGSVNVDLGIFGSISQNINLDALQEQLSQAFALIGNLIAQQIPTPSLLHDDLSASMAFDFGDIPGLDLNIPLDIADSQVFTVDFDVPVDLGIGSFTLDGSFSGTLNYNLNATASIAAPQYNAIGTLAAAVNVPEANTLVLLGAVGLGGLYVQFRRRRS